MHGSLSSKLFPAVALFFCLALASTALTGCGGNSGGASPVPQQPSVPTVTIQLSPYYQGKTTAEGDAYFQVNGAFPSVSYSCRLNGSPVACAAGTPIHYSGLADMSTVVVKVTATDLSTGLADPTARASAEVDASAPTINSISFSQVPNNGSALALVSFDSSDTVAGGVIFSCGIDGNVFTCAPGSNQVDGSFLTEGSHTLTITAIDLGGLGNVSLSYTASAYFDLTGPMFDPAATWYPAVPVASTSTVATQIRFAAFDPSTPVTYSCELVFPNGELHVYSPCDGISATNGTFRWAGLPSGLFTLVVTAFDFFGNSTRLNAISLSIQ